MSLSQGERRAFEQIIASLCSEDPSFAARVRVRSRGATRVGRLLRRLAHPGRPWAAVATVTALAIATTLLVVGFVVPRRAGSMPPHCAARACAPPAGHSQPRVPLEGGGAGAGTASGAEAVRVASLVEHWRKP